MPPGYSRDVTEGRRPVGRERRIVLAFAAVCAVAVAVVVIVLATQGSTPLAKKGCLNVTFASSLGGQQVVACGAEARSICADVDHPGGYDGPPGQVVAKDCRRLNLPVG